MADVTAYDQLFIGGEWVAPAGSEVIEVVSPSTEEVVGRVPDGTAADMLLVAGHPAVRAIAPALFGGEVEIPADGEHVALGAARQAAWALTGELPEWDMPRETLSATATPEVYGRYREIADMVAASAR